MNPSVQTSSWIRRYPTHLLFECFDSPKVIAGTNLANSGDVRGLGFELRNVIGLDQVHGDQIAWVTARSIKSGGNIPATDAVFTQDSGVLLTIRTADCVPVFMFDPETSTIALVHAGWRGARLGIVRKTVEELIRRVSANPCDLEVALGPAIRDCCYEFEPDAVPEFRAFMRQSGNKFYFDLPAFLTDQLRVAGVPGELIHDARLCTYCHPDDFFSHRRDGESSGRMVSFMWKKGR